MTIKAKPKKKMLEERVRQFYDLLDQKAFAACYAMIDPTVREDPVSVTLFQYQNALTQFLYHFQTVTVKKIVLELHLNEPSQLYGDRDFAVGETVWEDHAGNEHTFQERWVRDGRSWYTRSTGFVTPGANLALRPAVKQNPMEQQPNDN